MGYSSPCNLFFLLLLVRGFNGSESREMKTDSNNFLRLPSMNFSESDNRNQIGVTKNHHDHHYDHDHHHHHHHHMVDPSLMVFFTLNDLKIGKRMQIYFSKKAPESSPKFLPREEAASIPFSLKQLPFLLNFFSFPQESPQAKAIEDTLIQCEIIKPIKGETKFCATSIESMFDFAKTIFGSNLNFSVLNTKYLTVSNTLFKNYTILEDPKEVPAPKMVACHVMPYPYGVYYCHSQESESKVFRVSLASDDGDEVDAVAVCHMDTSQWSRSHVSFSVLGLEPGTSNVCHFFPADNLVMVPS